MTDEIKKLLLEAIGGESVARNKYTYYSDKAKKEGYENISKVFKLTADNEEAHAKIWFKQLGLLNDTMSNLDSAINGELYEHEQMYPRLEKEARELGDEKLANLFRLVGQIEYQHSVRYKRLLNEMKNKEVFTKPEEQTWICLECGYETYGKDAPSVCPVCSHPQAYFTKKSN